MKKVDIKLILTLFVSWRLFLFVALFLAIKFIPLQRNFLGGGMSNYLAHPYLFAWANFDGEHYLSIATIGYRNLEQAFFPIYPALMKFLAAPFSINLSSLTWAGLVISNLSTAAALVLLYKLVKLDYPKKISLLTLLLLLAFPTSFYLGSVYNESFYLMLSLAAFYAIRRDKWLLGGLIGALASATRIFGILLLPAFLIEAWGAKVPLKKCFWILLVPLGLLIYMLYQWKYYNDPLAFYNLQLLVGEQHQRGIILLPQVFFRYAKMLLTVDRSNPIYLTIVLEAFTGVAFSLLPVYGFFKKMRPSYVFYALAGFLAPTIQGSFSSVPRYALAFFPSFIALALLTEKYGLRKKSILIGILLLWLLVNTALFVRGYWVA